MLRSGRERRAYRCVELDPYTLRVDISTSSGGSGFITSVQGYISNIIEGQVGDVVTFTITMDDQPFLTLQCTETANIVGPDEMQAEYGQLTIGLFQPGNTPFAECASGWEEGPV